MKCSPSIKRGCRSSANNKYNNSPVGNVCTGQGVSVNKSIIDKYVLPTALKIAGQKHVLSVRDGIILNMPEGQFFNPQVITKQGLDTVARNYPASVSAGIEALRQLGLSPNWEPPKQ